MWFHRVLGSKPPIFQYLQGLRLGPEQESNVLPILAGKGDTNQDPYLEGVKTRFSPILTGTLAGTTERDVVRMWCCCVE